MDCTNQLCCSHLTQVPSTPPPPTSGTGKFYYPEPSKATYVGDWKLLFVEEPVDPVADKKKGKDKKEEPQEPTEPPRRVRHGRGVYKEGDYVYDGEFNVSGGCETPILI